LSGLEKPKLEGKFPVTSVPIFISEFSGEG